MKSNQPIAMLVGILLIATAVFVWNVMRYTSTLRDKQRIETQLGALQTEQAALNAVATEAVEYSKKNPAIIPVLKEFNLPVGNNAPAATGTKPSTR